MPVINVTLMEGYSDGVLSRLCTRLTDAAMATIDAPADGVTVFVNQVAPADICGAARRRRRDRRRVRPPRFASTCSTP